MYAVVCGKSCKAVIIDLHFATPPDDQVVGEFKTYWEANNFQDWFDALTVTHAREGVTDKLMVTVADAVITQAQEMLEESSEDPITNDSVQEIAEQMLDTLHNDLIRLIAKRIKEGL